jgi:preprotein translocase subunit SecA
MISLLGKLFIKAIGGTRNERIVRSRMRFVVDQVNPLEEQVGALSDEQLKARSLELRALRAAKKISRGDMKAEAFAMIREASRRARNHRQFDVQLAAGQILDEGWIAEEATGEGKTIACYPAIYMAVLDGMHVHVVTVNDYLVRRDAEFAKPIFELLGVSVGFIQAQMDNQIRKPMYEADVTYGTNSEFGFDYLRDNTRSSVQEQVQSSLDFAIVDEVDSILVDEARTPLIISGPAHGDTERFRKADSVARDVIARHRPYEQVDKRVQALKREQKALQGELEKGSDEAAQKKLAQVEAQLATAENELSGLTQYYEVQLDKKAAHLTHEGTGSAQEIAGVGSFYVGANMEWPHLMENALRAHLVYERDKDYVVQNGEVIIVDEFTGRLMEGRQWSDGLHQAVEAKERVRVKEETQTIATVTIQNYFKMYKKLAGMTGTAMTEANEFMKIYKLDVAAVVTHRPVNRVDHNDRIYADVDNKYRAIVEEVNEHSKAGRPVLVGTTSVEKSERLSDMLTRTYGIEHELLNARPENAAREADIVAKAGQQHPLKQGSKQMVGNVTIATNMAGRGTDIKLGTGVVWENCKVPPVEKLAELGVKAESLFPPGSTKCCIHCPQYNPSTKCAHCYKPKIDADFPERGRTKCPESVPCGVHIVGTERHEARRIDNQLRGRAGRQGDPGSSRFFLSLRDDLMSVFAGEWTLKVLGWLGLSGEQAIEDRRISKGIERAQKKVEERNFEIRKNLLEYDEVMDAQRHAFYSQRQMILEGRGLEGLVMAMLRQSVDQSVEGYLDGKYPARMIAEWARQNLQVPLRDDQIHASVMTDLPDLELSLRNSAKEEATNVISITLGEYMDPDTPAEEWDIKGLASWAMSRFGVNVSQNQLRKMSPEEVEKELSEGAAARIDELDLSPVSQYLEPGVAVDAVLRWASNKFGITLTAEEMTEDGQVTQESAGKALMARIEAAYKRREIEYPVEYAIDMTVGMTGTDNVYAMTALVDWANRKYEAGLTIEDFREKKIPEIAQRLVAMSETWLTEDLLQKAVHEALGSAPTAQAAIEFARKRFDTEIQEAQFDGDIVGALAHAGRQFLRREMTELERFVLLQIYDSSWKDHLLAMDHLKSGIGLRGFAERDPRVAFKVEGSAMFQEMLSGIREKVTDMIFKVRLRAGTQMSNVYQISSLVHEQLSGYDHLAQSMDQTRQAAAPQKIETIRRTVPRVGRNEPCPCGSGKKYKQCHGKGT